MGIRGFKRIRRVYLKSIVTAARPGAAALLLSISALFFVADDAQLGRVGNSVIEKKLRVRGVRVMAAGA